MEESINSGDYRACPFCSEYIRRKAIKCKHCGSDIDSRRDHGGSVGSTTKPWHLTLLGVALVMAIFIAAYPTVVEHIEKRAVASAMIEKATTIPQQPARPADQGTPTTPVLATVETSGLAKLNFGEDNELVVGQSYAGSQIAQLLEANASRSQLHPESKITVQFAGKTYEILASQNHFIQQGSYKIVSIEEK